MRVIQTMSVADLKSTATLLEQGRAEDAKRALVEFIKLVPTYVAAHVLLATIYDSEKSLDEALEHWNRAYALNPASQVIESGLKKAVLRSLHTVPESEVDTKKDVHLDLLIQELESARIVPDPDVAEISDAELEVDIEDLVSETLARIYAMQKYYDEARQVYETLARQNPDRQHEFETKAIAMQNLALERN
ncbi:MAG: tetratricopeptide repeat protein [Bacteroidetes bacterium]|nr:tetratricopeptide repeat protein [Bacteroidota bacterium]